ncbi:hypothetical protein SZN_21996 [Streptomyces zinciresistens K42]|uniref:Uncharacterized protein n=1 Tax=Streptomyces zinciresistens K42 TaxID=700597 RepID=G2GFW5_9ACTN|nr:hypothetical protein [Streptomyces zinciresistens]EGX57593.1 hypothetical protein SZN_21996 [Streptomyces zinciresistens K42]
MDGARQGTNERFTIRQKITLVANRYVVTEKLPDGSEGRVLAFAEQKRMALKEQLTFYTDESRDQVLCTVRADQVLDVGATYEVRDAAGVLLGTFRKRFAASLLRSTWELDQPGHATAVGRERNPVVAVVRRIWDLLPLDLVPFVWPYHFDFTADGRQVLRVDKKIGLRDRYAVEVASPGPDRRLAVAQAVALDALQAR